MPFVSCDLVCAHAHDTTFLCTLCATFVEGCVVCVRNSLLEELHILFLSSLNVSTTVVPLSIIELTNSLCTESAAGDTPHHSVHFSFSTSLRYETGK